MVGPLHEPDPFVLAALLEIVAGTGEAHTLILA